MTVSSFFAGRGDVYFFSMAEQTPFISLLPGDYIIVQRHPYGAPPTASPRCRVHPGRCLTCPARQPPVDEVVKTIQPSWSRRIRITEKATAGRDSAAKLGQGYIMMNGWLRMMDSFRLLQEKAEEQAGIGTSSSLSSPPTKKFIKQAIVVMQSGELEDYRTMTHHENRVPDAGKDEILNHIITDVTRIVNNASTIAFGFVVDFEMTRECGGFHYDSDTYGRRWGFQFLQLELAVRSCDGSVCREIVVAIKMREADEKGPSDNELLVQDLGARIADHVAAMDEAPERRAISKECYEMPFGQATADEAACQRRYESWRSPPLHDIGIDVGREAVRYSKLETWIIERDSQSLHFELTNLTDFLLDQLKIATQGMINDNARVAKGNAAKATALQTAISYAKSRLMNITLDIDYRKAFSMQEEDVDMEDGGDENGSVMFEDEMSVEDSSENEDEDEDEEEAEGEV